MEKRKTSLKLLFFLQRVSGYNHLSLLMMFDSPKFKESQPSDDEFQCSLENFKSPLFTYADLNDLVTDLCFDLGKSKIINWNLKR